MTERKLTTNVKIGPETSLRKGEWYSGVLTARIDVTAIGRLPRGGARAEIWRVRKGFSGGGRGEVTVHKSD